MCHRSVLLVAAAALIAAPMPVTASNTKLAPGMIYPSLRHAGPLTGIGDEAGAPLRKGISDYFTSDGHFDLQIAEESGYHGPIDLKGYIAAIDSESGQLTKHQIRL